MTSKYSDLCKRLKENGWICYAEATEDNVKNLNKTLSLLVKNNISGILTPGVIYSHGHSTNIYLVLRAFLNGKYAAINLIVYTPQSKICMLHTIYDHKLPEITLVK